MSTNPPRWCALLKRAAARCAKSHERTARRMEFPRTVVNTRARQPPRTPVRAGGRHGPMPSEPKDSSRRHARSVPTAAKRRPVTAVRVVRPPGVRVPASAARPRRALKPSTRAVFSTCASARSSQSALPWLRRHPPRSISMPHQRKRAHGRPEREIIRVHTRDAGCTL